MSPRIRTIPVVFPPELVTSRSAREIPSHEVGVTAKGRDAIWSAAQDFYATGHNPAIALAVRRHGQLILDRTIGHARGNAPGDAPDGPKVRATPDTPFCIFSASKAITAMVIHMLDDRGALHVDDRVCEFIPEFARHGKEWVTLRHVLSHRAGFPSLRADGGLDLLLQPERIIEILCDAEPQWAPGRRLAYHAITGGFILGEVVQRVTGRSIKQVLEDEILTPLGFDGMTYGWPSDRLHEVAENAFTGPLPGFPVDVVARRALGVALEDAPSIANTREWLTAVVPAGNIVATASEATRFFELLRNEGELDGVRVFSPRTVRRAVVETAHLEVDFTMMLPIRYGVGFMLGANWVSLFGPDTPRAFGHLGFTNIFCWTDPARAISVALFTSGKPLISTHLPALGRLLRAISVHCPETT